MGQREFSLGVEEEFLVVDGGTRALCRQGLALLPDARRVLSDDEVSGELHHSQVETATPVCTSLEEVRAHLVRLRAELQSAATARGLRIVASGTHPFSRWTEDPGVTPQYARLEEDYQQLAHEQIICGCHVHVGVDDPEAAIEAMNRSRPWLSVILALTGNSPFWQGRDTGYASYRTEIWRRWPMAGTPEAFPSRAEFDAVIDMLLATESIDDPARLYWDVRPSARFPTLEFRVTDVCLTVDDAVMVAGLVRGLVGAVLGAAGNGDAPAVVRPELLKAATWRAARFGLDGDLVDVVHARSVPARALVDRFLGLIAPALELHGDDEVIPALVRRVLEEGTGATRQRRALEADQGWEAVVDYAVVQTG